MLKKYEAKNHKKHCVRAKTLLMAHDKKSVFTIASTLGISSSAVYRYVSKYKEHGLAFIETRIMPKEQNIFWERRKTRIINILHTPPNEFGINRTSWIYDAIIKVYEDKYHEPLPKGALKKVIKETKYTWRRARKVLTSPDPKYKEKLENVLTHLRNTKKNEAFFFIDEMGPYNVMNYGGVSLAGKGSTPIVTGDNKARGSVQAIAALEALTNQMTWEFIERKDASMVVSFLAQIGKKYRSRQRLVITWDAVSTHSAEAVTTWIERNNKDVRKTGEGPVFKIVPLPAKSQFLNVIESVFGGMKKAVIHNSNYSSKEEMIRAVDRHFKERNEYFKKNPKRAGHKIWDKELFDTSTIHGGLFRKL